MGYKMCLLYSSQVKQDGEVFPPPDAEGPCAYLTDSLQLFSSRLGGGDLCAKNSP